MKSFFEVTLTLAIMLFAGAACSLPGFGPDNNAGKPTAAISSPSSRQTLEMGQETTVKSVSVDAKGVVRVELIIDGQVVWVDANAEPQPDTPFIVAQPWTPETPGTHTIQVRAYNEANESGESDPVTVEVTEFAAAAVDETTPASNQSDTIPAAATTNTPTATPTASPASTPTDTPTPPPPETPAGAPIATDTPVPQAFEPTGYQPDGRFKDIWIQLGSGDSRLGYPTGPEIGGRNYAQQRFEKGMMFWWDTPEDPDYIWVLDSAASDLQSGRTSNLHPDTWIPGDEEYSCPEARDGGPVRGFGRVWCTHPELQTRLGYPAEPERGSGGSPPFARVQFFQGGVMVYSPLSADVFVLFEQGDWQRFDY